MSYGSRRISCKSNKKRVRDIGKGDHNSPSLPPCDTPRWGVVSGGEIVSSVVGGVKVIIKNTLIRREGMRSRFLFVGL